MLYAAYGMNLTPRTMHGFDAVPVGGGYLDGYALRARAFFDIEPCPGAAVPVGLWEIDDSALAGLDQREGYPQFYTREEVAVRLLTPGTVQAIIYRMTPDSVRMMQGRPLGSFYLEDTAEGRRYFGLPTDDLVGFGLPEEDA